MENLLLLADYHDTEEFWEFIKDENIDLKRKPALNINVEQLVHYLTIGGGLLGLSKGIIEYLKLKYQKRSITIKDETGKEIIVEAQSVEEVEKLLKAAKSIEITKITDSQEK